jgi:hypothetical protein
MFVCAAHPVVLGFEVFPVSVEGEQFMESLAQ